ncbi:MAG TPA: DUF5752 family protein [Thermodesulfobacteriota bacterium]|nr:DUF5752 family protein [Thermodesulfobacteriota bacterium]
MSPAERLGKRGWVQEVEEREKQQIDPFEFRECISIMKSTGRKAKTLRELRDLIATISDESLYHHTYQYYLKRQILEYNNDFAHWAGEGLEESALSEYFSNIDPFLFKDIDGLRKALLKVIDDYLERFPEPREAMAGNEFYFKEAIILLFPAGLRANNLAEFLIGIKYIDLPSIFYHFYEARVRLGNGIDDFSKWVEEALGRKDLAARIRAIDLLMHTLDGIREHLVEMLEEEVRKDMEVVPK